MQLPTPLAALAALVLLFASHGEGTARTNIWPEPFLTGGEVHSAPAVSADGHSLFVGSDMAYALDVRTGVKKWAFRTEREVIALKLSADGLILLVLSETGNLYALDASTGAKSWSFDMEVSVTSSFALSADSFTLFVGCTTAWSPITYSTVKKVFAIELAGHGRKKWDFTTEGKVTMSPALSTDGLTLFVGSDDYNFYALDASTGAKKWQFTTGGEVRSSAVTSVDGRIVFVGSGDMKLYALDASTGVKKWDFTTGGQVWSSPVLSANGLTLFVGSSDGSLYALEALTGAKRWEFAKETTSYRRQHLEPRHVLPVLSADSMTIFVSVSVAYSSKVYALEPESGVEKWDFRKPTSGESPCVQDHIQISDHRLFVGSCDHRVYALLISCDAGFTGGGANDGKCTACMAGQYKSVLGSSTCAECLASTYSHTAASTCADCPSGTYSGSATASTCMVCLAGTYSNTAASTCVDCRAGTYSHTAASTCIGCLAGTYSNKTASPLFPTDSSPVIASVMCSGSVACCISSTSSDSSSGFITDGPGDYNNDQNCQWVIEAPGAGIVLSFTSFSTEGNYDTVTIYQCQSSSCSSRVKVAELSGSVSSSAEYTSSTGILQVVFDSDNSDSKAGFEGAWAAYVRACKFCPAGTYSDVAASTCVDCRAGTYSHTAASTCVDCHAGTFSGATATTCAGCVVGTYSLMSASTCVSCDAGKYSSAKGAMSADTCINCGVGKYSVIVAASSKDNCTMCAAGKYLPATGASSESWCISCKAGKFSAAQGAVSAATCDACDIGKFSELVGASSSSDCKSCPASNGTCVSCAAGKHVALVGAGSKSECSFCPAGSTTAPAVSCTDCPAGTFSAAGSSDCSACEINTDSLVGSAACQCNAGFWRQEKSCAACAAGSYKERSGDGTCDLCSNNTYSAAVAATSLQTCMSCAEAYTSAAGSSKQSNCQPSGSSTPSAVATPYIKMQVILSCSAAAFTTKVQDNFKIAFAIAGSAGCECTIAKQDVIITNVSDWTRRVLVGRPPSRGLMQATSESIKVNVRMLVANTEQGNALMKSGALSQNVLNRQLAKVGVPPISEVSESPQLISSAASASSTWSETAIVGVTIASVTVVIMVGLLRYYRGHNKIAVEEEMVLCPELTILVREAVEKVLAEEQRPDGRMVGGIKDFKSGKFQDAAKGIKFFIGVSKSWHKAKECTTHGIIAEVKRLCDCYKCAKAQARVLTTDLGRNKEGDLTMRLAAELSDLQHAQLNEEPTQLHQERVDSTRAEIEAFGGWVYGSSRSTPVDWPTDSVTHEWGKYGQPMCEHCKDLGLDFSTIWADLHYILYESTSEKKCFNGIRDHGRGAMVLADFMELKEVREADLSEAQLVGLRLYTSHSFHAINKALRARHTPHPLPATVMCINDGLKNLCALDAESDDATAVTLFYRGFTDMQVAEEFEKKGGSEFAPMSTTKNYQVACGYAMRKGATNGSLLMKILTTNNLQRGSDLTFLSMFPDEAETLFPPLTFVQPTGRTQVIECKQGDVVFRLNIVEVTTTLPF